MRWKMHHSKTGKEQRHAQGKQDQSQLYGDAYAQLHRFADVYEDKTRDDVYEDKTRDM